jgi:hypothetical protein
MRPPPPGRTARSKRRGVVSAKPVGLRPAAAMSSSGRMRAPVGAAGALSLCPFAEGAWIQADGEAPGLHGGLGLGLRLALPPRPTNLLRLDAAWGDAGLGISAGWGQPF